MAAKKAEIDAQAPRDTTQSHNSASTFLPMSYQSISSPVASPTPSTASSSSTIRAPQSNNSAEEASLAQRFRSLGIKYPPAPTAVSEAGTATEGPSTSEVSSLSETPSVIDLRPSSPSDSALFATPPRSGKPQGPPTYYVTTPVWEVPGRRLPIYGEPICHLVDPRVLLGAEKNPAPTPSRDDIQDDTIRPSASVSVATTPRNTSQLTVMDWAVPPSDVSMATAGDLTHESVSDVTMQSAVDTAGAVPVSSQRPVDESSDDESEDDDEGMGDRGSGANDNNDSTLFGPVPLKPYASSCGNNAFEKGETTLGLSHGKYREWNAKDYQYDNDWMPNLGVPESALNGFTSRHHFEDLIGKGALKIGDELVLPVKLGGVVTCDKFARIVAYHSSNDDGKKGKKLPDLTLFVNGVEKGELMQCHESKLIVNTLAELEPQTKKASQPYKVLEVRRGSRNLGSIHEVRQKFHRWEIELNAWRCVNGMPDGRPRRAGKKEETQEE